MSSDEPISGPDEMAGQPDSGRLAGWLVRLVWLPIPVLLVAMLALWAAGSRTEYEADNLRMLLNFATRTLAALLIVFLVGRSFLVRGEPGLLLLGCGVAIWGAVNFILTTALATTDDNLGLTINNLGAWLSALYSIAGAFLLVRSKRTIRSVGLWLGVAYALSLLSVGLLTLAAVAHGLPKFFVPGSGGTLVRHFVLGSAIAMFALAAALLRRANRANLRIQ
jgi:hypothetical protein